MNFPSSEKAYTNHRESDLLHQHPANNLYITKTIKNIIHVVFVKLEIISLCVITRHLCTTFFVPKEQRFPDQKAAQKKENHQTTKTQKLKEHRGPQTISKQIFQGKPTSICLFVLSILNCYLHCGFSIFQNCLI